MPMIVFWIRWMDPLTAKFGQMGDGVFQLWRRRRLRQRNPSHQALTRMRQARLVGPFEGDVDVAQHGGLLQARMNVGRNRTRRGRSAP